MQGARMMWYQASSNVIPLGTGRWWLTKAEKLLAFSLLLFSVHLSLRNLYQGNRKSLQNAITVSTNISSSCDHSYVARSSFFLCFAPICRFSLASIPLLPPWAPPPGAPSWWQNGLMHVDSPWLVMMMIIMIDCLKWMCALVMKQRLVGVCLMWQMNCSSNGLLWQLVPFPFLNQPNWFLCHNFTEIANFIASPGYWFLIVHPSAHQKQEFHDRDSFSPKEYTSHQNVSLPPIALTKLPAFHNLGDGTPPWNYLPAQRVQLPAQMSLSCQLLWPNRRNETH